MVHLRNGSAGAFVRLFLTTSAVGLSVSCAPPNNADGSDPLSVGGEGNGNGPLICPAPIFQQCKACHDGRGTAGTPMGLNYYEDFLKPSHSYPSAAVFQVVQMRVHDTRPPDAIHGQGVMPPTGQLPPDQLQAIDGWVKAGAPDCGFQHAPGYVPPPTGTSGYGGAPQNGAGGGWVQYGAGGGPQPGAGGTGPGGGGAPPFGVGGTPPFGSGGGSPLGGSPGTGGDGQPPGTGGVPGIDPTPYLSPDGTYFIKEPPGTAPLGPDAPDAEYCFNLVAHGAQSPLPGDTSPFSVRSGEFYHEFQYKVPYPQTIVALSTKPIIDNNKVLHHWLTFHIGSDTGTDGSHVDEVGLQLGNELITGWAPGGNPPEVPPGVGIEMPKVGGFMAVEFHYFNNTGAAAPDRSGVRICGTTKIPANVATLTWLGTESINIPAQQQATATGNCTPGGGAQTQDIHLVFASPHMHTLGRHMTTVINRKGGGKETVVDQPFAFTDQREYTVTNIVHPGDTLTTTCTWQNTTSGTVAFGTSTTQEMCYDFVMSYPAHSLPNPFGGGIEGSSNMCLR